MNALLPITRLIPCDLFELPQFVEYLNKLNGQPVDMDKVKLFAALRMEACKKEREADLDQADAPTKRKNVSHDSYIKVSKRKVDDLLNWISELIILQAQLTTTASSIQSTALN